KDPLIKSQLLYQLSYASTPWPGFDQIIKLAAPRLSGWAPYSGCGDERKGFFRVSANRRNCL
ncbi:MAG: hypothetical protein ABJA20_15200, partial [Novosphingobium sp.]